jgi:hypothetical protein
MAKYIIMYQGSGPSMEEASELIPQSEGVVLLDRFGPNIVIEGPAPKVRELLVGLPGWNSSITRKIKHPDNRVRVKRPR